METRLGNCAEWKTTTREKKNKQTRIHTHALSKNEQRRKKPERRVVTLCMFFLVVYFWWFCGLRGKVKFTFALIDHISYLYGIDIPVRWAIRMRKTVKINDWKCREWQPQPPHSNRKPLKFTNFALVAWEWKYHGSNIISSCCFFYLFM